MRHPAFGNGVFVPVDSSADVDDGVVLPLDNLEPVHFGAETHSVVECAVVGHRRAGLEGEVAEHGVVGFGHIGITHGATPDNGVAVFADGHQPRVVLQVAILHLDKLLHLVNEVLGTEEGVECRDGVDTVGHLAIGSHHIVETGTVLPVDAVGVGSDFLTQLDDREVGFLHLHDSLQTVDVLVVILDVGERDFAGLGTENTLVGAQDVGMVAPAAYFERVGKVLYTVVDIVCREEIVNEMVLELGES